METLAINMIDFKKRIFITGATGFVGASLLHRLILNRANDVHILLRKESDTSRIDSILDRVTVHFFSLENKIETLENIKKIQPRIIYHIAALGTAVGRRIVSIEELMKVNTLGSIHLIDAAVSVGCECFVNTGSSSEYGIKNSPMTEDDYIEPNNQYGISKAAATQYASFIGKTEGFPIVTYRLFSVYGSLEDSSKLISVLISSYKNGNSPLLSNPDSVRDFIYIDDVVDCYLRADTVSSYSGDVFNIGSGIQTSIGELVNIIKDISGSSINPIYGQEKTNQIEPKCWIANNQKMKTFLQISPLSLREGLLKIMK